MIDLKKETLKQLPITDIENVTSVGGGDVNDAYEIKTASQKYFLLVQPKATKEFFMTEAAGLKDLAEADITVPEVYDVGEIGDDAYLLISFLEEGGPKDYSKLAEMIAKMHRTRSPNGQFGYPYPHQGGDATFDNDWTDSWIELFIDRRLDQLRDELIERNKWNKKQVETYEQARQVMVQELANHQSEPSLIHGDLWGGNHMFLTNGEPAIFDPAPFYGDREFDLGVTTSFGAYPQEFYQAYQDTYPMDAGYEKRLVFYRLYVFMVHLHKFGGIYEQRVDQTLDEILA
jgi:fructosamine-3-kinase